MVSKLKLTACLLTLGSTSWGLNTSLANYGAKGDDRSDDTAAIVAASTAVARAGGQLYIPSGTYIINPHKGHLVLGSNMTVYGPGTIRVQPGIGDFDYVMGPSPIWNPLSNVTIQGITVDENVFNNPSSVAPNLAQSQNILLGNQLTGLNVSGVTFYVSGLYAIKLSDKLNIKNSKIVFQAKSGTAWFDNSAIYMPSPNSSCSITNNIFQSTTQIANTAIEVHNTKNCTISGNTFDNYRIAVLPLDAHSLNITGNTITRAEYAISLWSETIIENVSVTNNKISVNNKDRQKETAAGIALYWCSICRPIGTYYNIQIVGNNISFQPDVRTNLDPSAFWGVGIMPGGDVEQVYIARNTIINAPIRGIAIGNSQVRGQKTSDVLIESNVIISPGNNTAEPWYEAGIALQGDLSSVTVRGNTIKNSASKFTGRYGIWSDPKGIYSSVSVSGNTVGAPYVNSLSSHILR
jgi:polygalacturonase